MVGMAEVKVCRAPDAVLMALGLGSCVGICAYDALAGVAGLAHVVLPSSAAAAGSTSPGKFADTAVPLLLEIMRRQGACLDQIVIALVAGRSCSPGMASGGAWTSARAMRRQYKQRSSGWACASPLTDCGGTTGRTIHLTGSGQVRVKTIGQGERPS